MGVDLLKHNQEAFQEINKMIESGITKIAVPRATGSGKTYLMGALAEKYNDDKKLVLEPTRPLLNSIEEKFNEFGIENTDYITYQKLIRMSDEDIAAMDYKLIFLDECHHGTTPVWGQKVNCLINTHSDSIIFGTSATTVRNDGVNVVETLFDGNAIGELPLSTAIARKVLPCPHYISTIYRLDDELDKLKKKVENSTNTKSEKKEFYKKMQTMKLHFEKSYGVPLILNKYIKVQNGKYLVFCKGKKQLDAMRDVVINWFHTAGIKNVHSYAVYSDNPDKEKDYKDFQEDNSDSLKLLFSINMLNEGLHIKDISGVLMLRTTQSILVYLQQLGRLVEAENLDKYLVVFDFVNNFSSVNDGFGLLKEIKEAIAREKESDPCFDDSWFMDIDTYFVIDQVVEIQEMFREIEGRLEGSWDLYIKALKQYKEREGNCLVPAKHIEVVDGMNIKLGQWCMNIRSIKNSNGKMRLTKYMENQLNEIDFVWNTIKYKFEKKVSEVAAYYKEYGNFPSQHSDEARKLGVFLVNIKQDIKKNNLPEWKMILIKKYIPEFSSENNSVVAFNRFLYYARLYKEKNGHLNIKINDVMSDNYKIGIVFCGLKQQYEKGLMEDNRIEQCEELGIYLGNKFEKQFSEKMKLAEQAVNEGKIIGIKNQMYNEVNLYVWIRHTINKKYKNNDLSNEEKTIIEKLTGKSLENSFNNGIFVRIVDMTKKEEIAICKSKIETARLMQKNYSIKVSERAIQNRLKGKVKKPYKGRFMFHYATDEEIKKYIEDSKVS